MSKSPQHRHRSTRHRSSSTAASCEKRSSGSAASVFHSLLGSCPKQSVCLSFFLSVGSKRRNCCLMKNRKSLMPCCWRGSGAPSTYNPHVIQHSPLVVQFVERLDQVLRRGGDGAKCQAPFATAMSGSSKADPTPPTSRYGR